MEIAILVIVVIIMSLYGARLDKKLNKPHCKVHKWEYKEDASMFCRECGRVPAID